MSISDNTAPSIPMVAVVLHFYTGTRDADT